MKKLALTLMTTAAALVLSVNAFAVSVVVNDNPVDTEAVIVDGRTLVPVRGVFEELGYSVDWDANTKTATLTKDETTVIITSGMTTFSVNDTVVTPEVPQQIIDGHFMLPLRAVSEAVGVDVEWDEETKTAVITSKKSGGLKVVDTLDLSNGTIVDSSQVNEIVLE